MGNVFFTRIFFISTFLLPVVLFSQPAGFYFGPRVGFGVCRFSELPGMHMGVGRSAQIGLVADKQITNYFGVEFCPLVAVYKANGRGNAYDPNATSRSAPYSFKEQYEVGTVEFPLYAKFCISAGKFYISELSGVEVGMNMFGIRSRQYDDPNFNAKHGYWDHHINDISDAQFSATLGLSFEYKTEKRGVLSLDLRGNRNLSPMGFIDGKRFYADGATIGFTWKH